MARFFETQPWTMIVRLIFLENCCGELNRNTRKIIGIDFSIILNLDLQDGFFSLPIVQGWIITNNTLWLVQMKCWIVTCDIIYVWSPWTFDWITIWIKWIKIKFWTTSRIDIPNRRRYYALQRFKQVRATYFQRDFAVRIHCSISSR